MRGETACDQMLPQLDGEVGATLLSYAPGSQLLSEGEAPRGLLMMYDGLAELSITSNSGKNVFLGIATPGELLGLSEAISGKPSALTVVAIKRCKVALIEREDFLRYIREHSSACVQMVKRLSKDLGIVYHRARSF